MTPASQPSNNSAGDTDPRRRARQLALQCLYQFDVQKGQNFDQMDTFLAEYCPEAQICDLARQWIKGTWHRLGRIDKIISGASRNWEIDRISTVDRNNLRLAVFQLLDCPDIPPKAVINEAIELAKIFSTAQSPKFINGVLDAIKTKLRP